MSWWLTKGWTAFILIFDEMPRILAIDHGTVRIGLALSDETEIVASPFKTIDANHEPERAIARIVKEKHIGKIVIGMPST
jgi:putative Holliday junction resolvase